MSFCDEGTSKKMTTMITIAIAVPSGMLDDAFPDDGEQTFSSRSMLAASTHVLAVSARNNSFDDWVLSELSKEPRLARTKLQYEEIVLRPNS
jgi:hypothetical protein